MKKGVVVTTINEFIRRTRKIDVCGYETKRPYVICADGYSVSVQVGSDLYCTPREDMAEYYDSVELGYPNIEDSLINQFAEDPDDLINTVYDYVPVEIVDELLSKHGGIINFNDDKGDCYE